MDYADREHNSSRSEGEKTEKLTKVVEIVAIIAIMAIFVTNALTMQIDGTLTGALVGAIVFIATKKYYKMKSAGLP